MKPSYLKDHKAAATIAKPAKLEVLDNSFLYTLPDGTKITDESFIFAPNNRKEISRDCLRMFLEHIMKESDVGQSIEFSLARRSYGLEFVDAYNEMITRPRKHKKLRKAFLDYIEQPENHTEFSLPAAIEIIKGNTRPMIKANMNGLIQIN